MWDNEKTSIWAFVCCAGGFALFLVLIAVWANCGGGDFCMYFAYSNQLTPLWLLCQVLFIVGFVLAIRSIQVRLSHWALVFLVLVGFVFVIRYVTFGPLPYLRERVRGIAITLVSSEKISGALLTPPQVDQIHLLM